MSQALYKRLRPPRTLQQGQFQHLDLQRCLFSTRRSTPNPSPRPWQHHDRQRRAFTTTPHRYAGVSMKSSRQTMRNQAQPSASIQQKQAQREAMASGDIPDDTGLAPGTFIMPFGRNLPSWFFQPRDRWRLERKRLWKKMQDTAGLFYWRFVSVRPRPSVPSRFKFPKEAAAMYARMNVQFAAGNLGAMATEVCPGLLSNLRARLSQRVPGTYFTWTQHAQLSRPRLVSLRVQQFPQEGPNDPKAVNAIMQAVVRIHTRQSLLRVKKIVVKQEDGTRPTVEVPVDMTGKRVYGAQPEEKDSVAYVVMQRVMRRSQLGPWMIWGHAEETTLAALDKADNDAFKAKRKAKA